MCACLTCIEHRTNPTLHEGCSRPGHLATINILPKDQTKGPSENYLLGGISGGASVVRGSQFLHNTLYLSQAISHKASPLCSPLNLYSSLALSLLSLSLSLSLSHLYSGVPSIVRQQAIQRTHLNLEVYTNPIPCLNLAAIDFLLL